MLWVDADSGTAAELARVAEVNFASAYRELKAVARHDLVRTDVQGGREVYSANVEHPMAEPFRSLLAFRPRQFPPGTESDDVLRAQLAAAGGPIHAPKVEAFEGSREELFARGARLARRDASVARAFPVGLSNRRLY